MLTRKNNVVFLGAYPDGCCFWRMYVPHFSIDGSAFYCFNQKPDFNRIAGYDVAVVQRCCTQEQFNFVKLCKLLGIKVIYDTDDDLWDLPDYNPAAEMFKQLRSGFDACIRMADVITVSTRTLGKVVNRRVKDRVNLITKVEIPIVVVENKIDKRIFVDPVPSDKLIVGWAGSSSHIGDLELVAPAVNSLSTSYPDVEFQFRGCEIPKAIDRHSNVTHKFWSAVSEYGARMPLWGWRIALAPVTAHDFNNSKSPLKMIEAGYCKIPCLASYVDPYFEFCSHDKELMWLLCPGKINWFPKLRELINDEARRTDLGNRMRSVVDKYYSFDVPHEGWQKAIATARAI
jgi:glycosyltransferase involved in cell wall biosynthesis